MPYSDFTLAKIKARFGVEDRIASLFNSVLPVAPSPWLLQTLAYGMDLPTRTEKAKSEWIVTPVLTEVRNNNKFITIFSGENLEADPTNGLNGECDFILAKDAHTYSISYPIVQVVEAKKQDFDLGIPQCGAQLIGASLYNQQRGVSLEKIYGCVTTGTNWQFIMLEQKVLFIDPNQYSIRQLDELLGVFQHIINQYKTTLA